MLVANLSPVRFVGPALAVALLGACVGETPPNDIAAPDIERITVYFPLDSLVNGRGSPGPKPEGFDWVFIRPHPSRNVFTFARVLPDGSFTFRIAATGNDILEIAYADKNEESATRGAPSFVQVPLQPAKGQSFYCCGYRAAVPGGAAERKGRCQPTTEANMCIGGVQFPECVSEADCAFLSNETIEITPADAQVSQPDATGQVTVNVDNAGYRLRLLRVENRGQRAVGGRDPRQRDYVILDESGKTSIRLRARGDDEIVLQLFDINGYVRSREHALYVPDADLVGVDVVGLFPFEGLKSGETGRIGVRVAPHGTDLRGICPPSNEAGPALCFSGGHEAPSTGQNLSYNGGMDYEYLNLTLTLDGVATPISAPSVETRRQRNTKFTDGNVLAPPQSVVLIIDHSDTAPSRDGQASRFRAAEDFLAGARERDLIAVISTGTPVPGALESGMGFSLIASFGGRAAALEALRRLEGRDTDGDNGIFAATAFAGDLLYQEARDREGRILIITSAVPKNEAFTNAIDAITGDERIGRPRYPVYTVTQPICSGPLMGQCIIDPSLESDFESLAGFTLGRHVQIDNADGYLTSVATVTGAIYGAFVLMYEIDVPVFGGGMSSLQPKTAQYVVTVRANLPDPKDPTNAAKSQESRASLEGTLELRDNVGN